MPRLACSALLLLPLATAPSAAQQPPDTAWTAREVMIPMRDGVRLHTYVVTPRHAAEPLPILMQRTPYGASGGVRGFLDANRFLAADGYVFVFQDIRGRNGSEGDYLMNRPLRSDSTGVDEATDTYDTIEWLLANVPNTTGRVGGFGISYPGWLATMQALSGHPALRAVSPQAPMTDTWMGDDFFHNGAFRLSYGVEYTYGMEVGPFRVGAYDMYDWYRRLGPLTNVTRVLGRSWPSWDAFLAHPTYDAFWQARATQRRIAATPVSVLTVGGWYDQEDIFGPPATYAAFERFDTRDVNRLVMGPWNHGGWYRTGDSLGPIGFGDATGVWFRREVEAPFFAYYLKDRGPLPLPEALVFEGGANRWRRFDRWPPREAVTRNLYVREGGRLSFDAPTATGDAYDQYVSDPAYPVPYRPRPVHVTYSPGSDWRIWQVLDQRFVEGRPDVQVWATEPLAEDVVIAGDLSARLFASTTGGDADWVVKLIDVYPDTVAGDRVMGGFQLMVAGEILRGRYRRSFERPEPIRPNAVLDYTIRIPPQAYRFQRGHRIMVQVQSTWFPLYDRNPQTWVPDIFQATEQDYRAQTHRIWRTARYPSHIALPVIRE
ncbi:MAG: CocE/NonD family hydrolase [Gemmatimonadota bacterium]|nr:CocE/NonD family hydrolase [Gemmatimonadota bacterium]